MFDCVIIGGGPEGLTAATYLGRFLRRVVVIDSGESRLLRIPVSRNVPGFPDGVSGPTLRSLMQSQAAKFGAELVEGQATDVRAVQGTFEITSTLGAVQARTVFLASGVSVTAPPIEGIDGAVARGQVRYCPICDGFEAQGRNVAVLGGRHASFEEARFLRTYTSHVTFVPAAAKFGLGHGEKALALAEGIAVEPRSPQGLEIAGEGIRMTFAEGDSKTFEILYPCLGAHPRSELIVGLSVDLGGDGAVLTDRHYQTRVPGLYAGGDVLKGVDQIASACGQAAIAAVSIHNQLRK